MSTTAELPPTRVGRRRQRSQRILEIDGLRAIALTLVVLFHLFGQGRVSGGVDVFLVVSGFLMAASVFAAIADGKSLALGRRWGRIFTRLAPPALIVLLFVIAITEFVMPPWTREQTLDEVIAAALYFENWQLITSQLEYGAAGPLTSPVQHFWSLSIQAQFFVIFPLIGGGVMALARSAQRRRTLLISAILAGSASSFWFATVLNASDPAAAYFNSFARFWELGVGALVAVLVRGRLQFPPIVATLMGWVGIALILSSGFLIDGALAYPGPYALFPVAGAVLVLLSSRAQSSFAAKGILSTPALGALDRISYPLYLWHWPLLILYLSLAGTTELDVLGAGAVLAASVLAAVSTYFAVTRPMERLLVGSRHWAKAVGLAIVAASIVVGLCLALLTAVRAAPAVELTGEECLGAVAVDPSSQCDSRELPGELLPNLAALREDDDNRKECWTRSGSSELSICQLGSVEGYSQRILAVGDSHNNTLLGAYERIADDNNWRIDVAGKAGCHWTTWQPREKSVEAELCTAWAQKVTEYVGAQDDLDAIVVTHSSRPEPGSLDTRNDRSAQVDGLLDAWSTRDPHIPIVAIRDNPIFPASLLDCVQSSTWETDTTCGLPRSAALVESELNEAVPRDANAHLMDFSDIYCEDVYCPLVRGGVVVVRDGSHLTATFARTLAPYIERGIGVALRAGAPVG
ncbi:acyltransferase [Microbacterium sp. LRZ72]|uniref:acyltransferase family protein n=1 Tax=Microbacterium sp. LRZ72 TaxID=2942481 RepID=UPI0029AB7EFA|nr:acyltransferase family protein [Microbacterium sp. LRZ72]MDX2377030.1 acyltransferase [Microbacterium sp. LRZ72]